MTAPMERIQLLDTIEKDIIMCLQSAGTALLELSKEKSSQKQAESQTHLFLKTLGQVESKLTDQINYLTQVSTGQPHEGSGYASQKVLQMAWHRLEHIRCRVNELERLKNSHLPGGSRSAARAMPGAAAVPQQYAHVNPNQPST
ncbi:mediator complex subunit 11 [Rhodnius prolixus]|uniref:Mediator of RNA polymerase II transcription subunit 11 n=2 Tax=Rhodnius TaxID=13248 RepID=R4G3K7_RHOPR